MSLKLVDLRSTLLCFKKRVGFWGFLSLWEATTLSNGRLLCEHLTVCGGGPQGAFGKFPHGKRDGFPTMNILTLEQFPPFGGDSYIFPTHKRGLCQEGML